MDNGDDLTQPAFVFWMQEFRLRAGGVTRFDRLEDAVHCVMQHAFARTVPVAWIKTMNRHQYGSDPKHCAALWFSKLSIKNRAGDEYAS